MSASADRPADLPVGGGMVVVPVRHYGRAVAGAAVLLVLLGLVLSVARNENLDFAVVAENMFEPVVLGGVGLTLLLTFISMAVGILIGVIAAIARLSPNPVLRSVSAGYVWFFRGTPVLVQLIFWFNIGIIFPRLGIGIPFTDVTFWSVPINDVITPLNAAILGLGLNSGAYIAEIIRAGILSVSKGQVDAAYALGMSRRLTMRRIVLPQSVPIVIPPLSNEFIGMLKYSALASVIAVQELLGSVENIYSRNLRVLELLIVASIWYLIITTFFTFAQRLLERRFSRGRAMVGAAGGVRA
ncbi:MAG: amino acid ABC transporter permease [Actinomycetales bacterium]|nr:amino acid ABC transporter permease [Actinomycetales bacterium]